MSLQTKKFPAVGRPFFYCVPDFGSDHPTELRDSETFEIYGHAHDLA